MSTTSEIVAALMAELPAMLADGATGPGTRYSMLLSSLRVKVASLTPGPPATALAALQHEHDRLVLVSPRLFS